MADAFQHAAVLVSFIKKFNETAGLHPDTRGFGIGVAGFPEGHPGTPNRMLEMDYLKAKVDAGADYIVTQLFFDNRDFYDFRERWELAGIHVPVIAGLMPVTSLPNYKRIPELTLGAVPGAAAAVDLACRRGRGRGEERWHPLGDGAGAIFWIIRWRDPFLHVEQFAGDAADLPNIGCEGFGKFGRVGAFHRPCRGSRI